MQALGMLQTFLEDTFISLIIPKPESHFLEKYEVRKHFKKVSLLHQYGGYDAPSTSKTRLLAITLFLEEGFEICKVENQIVFEHWALEKMTGCLKGLQRKERKKGRLGKIMSLSRTDLFKSNPQILLTIIEAMQSSQLTPHSAKLIIRELLLKPCQIQELIKKYSVDENCRPAPPEEVRQAVKEFLENIKFYLLREKIERATLNCFMRSKSKYCGKPIARIYREIRKILQIHDVINLVDNNNKLKLLEKAPNICAASAYYQTNVEAISALLENCLKIKEQIKNDNRDVHTILTHENFNLHLEYKPLKGKLNFVCQPIMQKLNYRTSGNDIMKALDEVLISC